LAIVLGLAIIGAVLATVGVAGKLTVPPLVERTLRSKQAGAWKVASAASTLLSWAVALLAVEWLVAIASLRWSTSGDGHIIVEVIAGGLVVAYIVALASRGSRDYWKTLHASLGVAIRDGGTESQRTTFNEDHMVLASGREAGRVALKRILNS
jgi:hypothetical protein